MMTTLQHSLLPLIVVITLWVGGPAGHVVAAADTNPTPSRALPEGSGSLIVGSAAPDFVLTGVDGDKPVRLADLRGKPVVLYFGSCTCPIFRQSVGEIGSVSAAYQDQVQADVVYIREAHPNAGLPSESGGRQAIQTNRERDRIATAWTAVFSLLGGTELVLVLYARTLGRRRFALASLPLCVVAVACAVTILLTSPEDFPTEPNPFALHNPAVNPRTQEERDEVAAYFVHQFYVSIPTLVDTSDDKVEGAYGAMPARVYVIDQEGKVAYQSGAGPGGYCVSEVPPVLDRLLEGGR
jgi:hypothetical protein